MSDNPKTLAEELQEFTTAVLDLAYTIVKPLLPLYAKIPWLTPRPWVRERQIRELHRR